MPNSSDTILRAVLGPTLQTASLRAILILAAFSAVGAALAWLML